MSTRQPERSRSACPPRSQRRPARAAGTAVVGGHDQQQAEHRQLGQQQLAVGGLEQGRHRADQDDAQDRARPPSGRSPRRRPRSTPADDGRRSSVQDRAVVAGAASASLSADASSCGCAVEHGDRPAASRAGARRSAAGVDGVARAGSVRWPISPRRRASGRARSQHHDQPDQPAQPHRGAHHVHHVGRDGGPGRRGGAGMAEEHERARGRQGRVERQRPGRWSGGGPATATRQPTRPGQLHGALLAEPARQRPPRQAVDDASDRRPPSARAAWASMVRTMPTTPMAAAAVARPTQPAALAVGCGRPAKAEKKVRPAGRQHAQVGQELPDLVERRRPPWRSGGRATPMRPGRGTPTRNTTPPLTMCPSVEVDRVVGHVGPVGQSRAQVDRERVGVGLGGAHPG